MKIRKFIFLMIITAIISACDLHKSSEIPDVTPPVPPKEGQATLIGRVISKDTGLPMTNEVIRLAEVYRQGDKGVYVLDMAFSPGARSDAKGYFIFENIPAQEYVVIVGDYNGTYDIIQDPDTRTPKTFALQPGQIFDVGEFSAKLMYHP